MRRDAVLQGQVALSGHRAGKCARWYAACQRDAARPRRHARFTTQRRPLTYASNGANRAHRRVALRIVLQTECFIGRRKVPTDRPGSFPARSKYSRLAARYRRVARFSRGPITARELFCSLSTSAWRCCRRGPEYVLMVSRSPHRSLARAREPSEVRACFTREPAAAFHGGHRSQRSASGVTGHPTSHQINGVRAKSGGPRRVRPRMNANRSGAPPDPFLARRATVGKPVRRDRYTAPNDTQHYVELRLPSPRPCVFFPPVACPARRRPGAPGPAGLERCPRQFSAVFFLFEPGGDFRETADGQAETRKTNHTINLALPSEHTVRRGLIEEYTAT